MTRAANDPAPGPVVLVGFSRDVLGALEVVGHRALVVIAKGQRRPEHEAIEAVCEVDLHGPLAAVERAVRERLAERTPATVVALAERTVLVAAHLRAAFGLPGNSPKTALSCADKVVMKRAMEAAGVPVAPWREVRADTTARELIEALGLPVLIKPRRDSGGRAQRKLDTVEATEAALAVLAREAPRGYGWLAEGWIVGREMSVEAFVRGGAVVFANPTEYYVPRHANIVPAELEADVWREVRAFTERAIAAAEVERGIVHLELFRTTRGLVFGELASRPPGGRLMKLLGRAWGFDPWEMLLRHQLGEAPEFPASARRTAGVWILHPGAGTLKAVHGLERARALPHVRRVALKVRPGDTIAERIGSGQDVGAVYAEGPTRDAVADALSTAHATLRFELA